MRYEKEELFSIVEALAKQYTCYESSSITYEKAEQLMEAVLYCINEVEERDQCSLILNEGISAQKAYEIGVSLVKEKAEKALALYNSVISSFYHYENQCLYDTFVKGMPEFFKWYNIRYLPQDTILTLDYPILKDLSDCTGIDKIFEYIKCISLEQKFLKRFPDENVIKILSKNDKCWKESFDNICEIVFTYMVGHILIKKPLMEILLKEEDYTFLQKLLLKESHELLQKHLEAALDILVKEYYDSDAELREYLVRDIGEIIVRLKSAAENNVLQAIV